jgi:hypothetical protein
VRGPRPFPVSLVGAAFLAFGAVALPLSLLGVATMTEPGGAGTVTRPLISVALALAARLVALVAGIYVLRGANWARWLVVGWLAYHAGLSLLHDPVQLAVHATLLFVVACALFRAGSATFFAHTPQRIPT